MTDQTLTLNASITLLSLLSVNSLELATLSWLLGQYFALNFELKVFQFININCMHVTVLPSITKLPVKGKLSM